MSFPFNVRVYGALVHRGHILLSDEHYAGRAFTKLPGGGLEYGEGLRDALSREFMEELELEVKVLDHLYTTDFFVASAFNPEHQVISVYYRVALTHLPEGIPELIALVDDQKLKWVALEALSEGHFTFPVDKKMVPLLKGLPDIT